MTCAHCSLPLGRHVVDERFCCSACAAVHRLLEESGAAGTYYRLQAMGGGAPQPATEGADAAVLSELDSPVFLDTHTSLLPSGERQTTLHLDGVHCAACVWLVERLPSDVAGVSASRLDLPRARVTITWRPEEVTLASVAAWLGRYGYTPHPVADAAVSAQRYERRLLWRLGMAWALAANVMILAAAFYSGLDRAADSGLYTAGRWASLILTVPVLAVSGREFFVRAWRSVRRAFASRSLLHLDMDTPVALGLLVGFGDSARATLTGSGDIWFDSLAVLTAALLTARWLQIRSRRLAGEEADRLLAVMPTMATRLTAEGTEERVASSELLPGHRIAVSPGDLFPADGVVLGGNSHVDRSAMTGESRTEPIQQDSEVLAGTTNVSAPVTVEVTRVGAASRLGRLVEEAAAGPERAAVPRLSDRISGYFVAAVLLLALVTGVTWALLEPESAVAHTVALLVVTCPCALGMATPLAQAIATGKAARLGLFIKNTDALEALNHIDILALDKTGTVTEGRPRVVLLRGSQGGLSMGAALEHGLSHPVARAIRAAATRTGLPTRNASFVPGCGVSGFVEGKPVRIGKPEWVLTDLDDPDGLAGSVPEAVKQGLTPVCISVDNKLVTVAGLGDALREESADLVAQWHARGIRVHLISGDHPDLAGSVGGQLGIPASRIMGNATPEAKKEAIRQWQAQGLRVAMVGDGLNDAAALAQAEVGIAIDSGSQASRFSADIVATRNGLSAVELLLQGARSTRSTIRRNLSLSLLYNLVVATLAMLGLVTPLVAAVAMPISSLSVVLSSVGLRAFSQRRARILRLDHQTAPPSLRAA